MSQREAVSAHAHTNAVDIKLNLRTQEFVPLVDGVDQIAAALKGAGAAERMCKRGIRREVGIDGFRLRRISMEFGTVQL
jgi:hypothetical protein